MASLNKVFLIGNLTRDPSQRFLPSGQGIAEFGIATNRKYTVNGEKREEVAFIDCEAWGPTGDAAAKYLRKGAPAFIEGRLKFEQWTTKEGEKKSRLKVVAENIQFLMGRDSSEPKPSAGDLSPADFGLPASAQGESDVPF